VHLVVVVVVVVEEEEEGDGLLQHHVKKLASWTCKSLIQIMWGQTQLCKISLCAQQVVNCKFAFTFFGNPMISCMSQ
jgi:hypothetical protein